MSNFGNYDPSSFGWSVPDASDIVPFSYNGVVFPSGVHRVAVPAFTALVKQLLAKGYIPGGLQSPGCWGYEYRPVTGNSTGLSFHAYGTAIDINAPQNGYRADGTPGPHSIDDRSGSLAHGMGFEWGGGWTKPKDYMHFELHLSPAETQQQYPDTGTEDDMTPAQLQAITNTINEAATHVIHTVEQSVENRLTDHNASLESKLPDLIAAAIKTAK